MPLPIINFDPLLTAPSVRGIGWSLKLTENWKTLRQEANRRVVKLPQYNNPLYEWELKWNYVSDAPSFAIKPTQSQNAPFTDFEVLRSLYFFAKASGNEFLYQPINSAVTNQLIAPADANGNSEVVITVGGYQSGLAAATLSVTSVQVSNNILTCTIASGDSAKLAAMAPGMTVNFSTFVGASFLNGQQGIIVTAVNTGSNTFRAFFSHANYGPTSDSGTTTIADQMVPINESVQSLSVARIATLQVNGAFMSEGSDYSLSGPSTVAPYDGFVIVWSFGAVLGATPPAGSLIQADFTRYYQCEFSDDSLEYENFLPFLWKVGSLKFKQVGL